MKRLPISFHQRKYVLYFLKLCPKRPLRMFLENKVIISEEYRILLIRRYVDNRTPKQLSLEFCSSTWWIGERLRRAEDILIPQLESFVMESMNFIS